MNFTVSEKYGEKSIKEWLVVKVQDHVKQQHGINIKISIVLLEDRPNARSLLKSNHK